MSIHRRCINAWVAGLVVGLTTGSLSCLAQPLEIRAGWIVPPPTQLVPVWNLTPPNAFKHNGKSYVLKDIQFRGASPMVTAIGAGELDLALLPPHVINLAVVNAGLKDLRIVADEILDGYQDYFTGEFRVLKDSPIKSPADLKGKTVATLAIGSGVDLAGRNMLARHGLLAQRDYNLIEVAPPHMKAFLLEKKADLVFGFPPFVFEPEFQEKSRLLFTSKESFGFPSGSAYWTMRTDFIRKNRAAIVDFMEDYLRLGRWYWDPANRKDVLTIISNVTKVPAAVLDTYVISKKDAYRPPDELPDLVANQRIVQIQKELGLVKDEITLADYGELSMIKEAAQRLK